MRIHLLVAIAGLIAWSGFVCSAEPVNPPQIVTTTAMPLALSGSGAGPNMPSEAWIDGEFVFGWLTKGPLPSSLTTRGAVENAPPRTIGQNEDEREYITLPGGRLSAGTWLDPDQSLGVEARGFLLGQGTLRQVVRFETEDPRAAVTDSLRATSTARLWGCEANILVGCCRESDYRADLLGGFRYLELSERLQIDQLPRGSDGSSGPVLAATDNLRTRNQFYGGQVGGRILYQPCTEICSLDLRALVALGATRQTIDISGTTIQTTPGLAASTLPYGVLTSTSKRGRVTTDQFSVLPQADFRVCCQPVDCLRVFVGYSLLCWSNVSRPGNQISLDAVRDSFFYAQGITLGGEYRY